MKRASSTVKEQTFWTAHINNLMFRNNIPQQQQIHVSSFFFVMLLLSWNVRNLDCYEFVGLRKLL